MTSPFRDNNIFALISFFLVYSSLSFLNYWNLKKALLDYNPNYSNFINSIVLIVFFDSIFQKNDQYLFIIYGFITHLFRDHFNNIFKVYAYGVDKETLFQATQFALKKHSIHFESSNQLSNKIIVMQDSKTIEFEDKKISIPINIKKEIQIGSGKYSVYIEGTNKESKKIIKEIIPDIKEYLRTEPYPFISKNFLVGVAHLLLIHVLLIIFSIVCLRSAGAQNGI